jgi:pheromone shutdown-related protein TraB
MIKRLLLNDKEVILVGTAHVSKESIELAIKTIEEENPDIVGVELDKGRLDQLLSGQKWQETNIVDIVKNGQTYLFLLNIFLSNMQKQIGKTIGVKPGSEMLAAVKKTSELKKPISLLDRDIKITLKRAFSLMTLKEKLKLGTGLIGGMFGHGEAIDAKKIEELKQEDLINKLMKELGNQMPSIKQVLVDERDQYISEIIRKSPGKKIVAVVGAGHLRGIEKILKENKKVNMKEITTIPKKKNYFKYLKWIIPLFMILLFAGLFYFKGATTTVDALLIWFLANGIFSALGAIIARAHIISVLVSFFAAPFTSLHPAFAAGWFAAASEARFNPPKVRDFDSLNNVDGISSFNKNKVTHLLIVAAIVNIGSMIGTIFALPLILNLLL